MQPKPEKRSPAESLAQPVLEVLDDLVPTPLHIAAWASCNAHKWYFGHGSNTEDFSRFWKLELDGDSAFDAIWEHVRPRCEALAGASLRVVRQYANGHTYGLGGSLHRDDVHPGTFTLLYYPNPEWNNAWEGETVYYDGAGEIALAVRPRPNRGVFFDSRIPHVGRAPSRLCPHLRVTVAYKLVVASNRPAAKTVSTPAEPPVAKPAPAPADKTSAQAREIRREGALRVFRARIPAAQVDAHVRQQLEKLGQTVRLPGFRPGKIPLSELQERYGAQARVEALNHLGAEASEQFIPRDAIPGSLELLSGRESGDLEFEIAVTCASDFPSPDFSEVSLERPAFTPANLQSAGVSADQAAAFSRDSLKAQLLDKLDALYPFPVLPSLAERELATIVKAAIAAGVDIPDAPDAKTELIAEYRRVAERRVRLGALVTELAARFEIRAASGPQLEDQVIGRLIDQAKIIDRPAAPRELLELANS